MQQSGLIIVASNSTPIASSKSFDRILMNFLTVVVVDCTTEVVVARFRTRSFDLFKMVETLPQGSKGGSWRDLTYVVLTFVFAKYCTLGLLIISDGEGPGNKLFRCSLRAKA